MGLLGGHPGLKVQDAHDSVRGALLGLWRRLLLGLRVAGVWGVVRSLVRLALLSGVVEQAGLPTAHLHDDLRADGANRHVLLSIEGDVDDGRAVADFLDRIYHFLGSWRKLVVVRIGLIESALEAHSVVRRLQHTRRCSRLP